MYLTSKSQILLEAKFDFPIPQQLMPSGKAKINLINNGRLKKMTFGPIQIGLIFPIRQH